MKPKSVMLYALLIAVIASPILASTVYADDSKEVGIGIDLGKQTLESAASGTLAGLFLSTVIVIGKHIQNEAGKQPDPKKYGLNIIIGAISAVVIGSIPGLNAILGAEATSGLTFTTAFAVLFFVDQVIRPIFGNWAKGADAQSTRK